MEYARLAQWQSSSFVNYLPQFDSGSGLTFRQEQAQD